MSKLLKEAFMLEKEPLVDRAHGALLPMPHPGDRPRATIAKLHYYTDWTDILRKARELQRIKLRNTTISIFPDHTPRTARARAAANEVRRLLRYIDGVRFGLLYPARMWITYKGERLDFTSPDEAKAYIKTITFCCCSLNDKHMSVYQQLAYQHRRCSDFLMAEISGEFHLKILNTITGLHLFSFLCPVIFIW